MPTPTEVTVAEYFAAIRSMDVERCVAVFTPDAEQHDPFGTPPNIGHDAIWEFFTQTFGSFQSVSLTEDGIYTGGNAAAVKWIGKATAANGKSVDFEGVDVIDCNAEGKIVKVRAFWDPGPVMAALQG